MSGVGKTTIGKSVSAILNRKFIDTDKLIEDRANMTIEKIFSVYGEDYFRQLEFKVIDELYGEENLIISTGGGTILNNNNVIKLKKNGILILLDSSIDNIVNNINRSSNTRPLLNVKEDLYKRVETLYNLRKDLYRLSSDYIICVNDKSIDEIVYEVLTKCVKINS